MTNKEYLKNLDKLVEDGYLRKVISPCKKLVLYNYTDHCTYEKKWNKYTLNARGTVYEIETGKVIARAFPKFFNFGELAKSKQRNILKKTDFEVFEKMDGSLGIVYFYDGKWRVNTRGSFTSDQAIKATEMLSKYNMDKVAKDYTLMCEIIYPENRIIVDYKDTEELVLLAAYDLEWGGADQPTEILNYISEGTGIRLANSYKFNNIDEIIDTQHKLDKMEEGFVVKFSDGYRCKFKSKEYLKIARIISNMTPLNFWRNMENGIVKQDILEQIPEEFRTQSDDIKNTLESAYKKVAKEIEEDYKYSIQSIGGLVDLNDDRKKLGIFLQKHGNKIRHQSAMFSKLLNKDIDKYIIKMIRPSDNQYNIS